MKRTRATSGIKPELDKKKELTSSQSNFGNLNSDCLIHIFSYLPILDRLNVQAVCKQWYAAVQDSWKYLKRLDVDRAKWTSRNLREFERVEINVFKTILEKCGRYLVEIDFDHLCAVKNYVSDYWDDNLNHYKNDHDIKGFKGITALTSNCTKIEKLNLHSMIIKCNDRHLRDLFRMNKNIRFLSLTGYKISGSCFIHLSAEIITTLRLRQCEGIKPKNVCMLLKRCTNLNALNIDFDEYEDRYKDFLETVRLHNIKTLKELALGYLVAFETTIDSYLPINDTFKYLEAFQIIGQDDKYLMEHLLTDIGKHCKNLKIADFSGCSCITDDILIHITTLPKLEILCIDRLNYITNKSLCHLSKYLKVLKCVGCQITDSEVITLLNKSQYIELLDLSMCHLITNKSVNHAIDVAKSRTNNVVLSMCVGHSLKLSSMMKNKYPLFRLCKASKEEDFKSDNYDDIACNHLCQKNFYQKKFCLIDTPTVLRYGCNPYI